MSKSNSVNRPIGIYLIIIWMAINAVFLTILIPNDPNDLNNYLEPILWVASIAGLVTMRKAGAALTTTVLAMTLSTSMFNVMIAYYTGFIFEPVGYVNAIRIVVNIVAVVYLFRLIFSGKFR